MGAIPYFLYLSLNCRNNQINTDSDTHSVAREVTVINTTESNVDKIISDVRAKGDLEARKLGLHEKSLEELGGIRERNLRSLEELKIWYQGFADENEALNMLNNTYKQHIGELIESGKYAIGNLLQ